MTKIQFELDGKQVEAINGETIWQVAKRQGREIPHLCYSPAPDYRPDGNCRACMVEIEGERVLAASCKRTPSVGMKVKTESPRAVAAFGIDDLLVLDLIGDLTADAAERAQRVHLLVGIGDAGLVLVQHHRRHQGAGRAGLHAFAAGDAG